MSTQHCPISHVADSMDSIDEAHAETAEGATEASVEDVQDVHRDPDGANEGVVPTLIERWARAEIQTVRLDSRDIRPSWPTAIALLEQLAGWAVLALRLGTLALIQQCVRELAEEDAHADVIVRLRALTEALAHMPLEA